MVLLLSGVCLNMFFIIRPPFLFHYQFSFGILYLYAVESIQNLQVLLQCLRLVPVEEETHMLCVGVVIPHLHVIEVCHLRKYRSQLGIVEYDGFHVERVLWLCSHGFKAVVD